MLPETAACAAAGKAAAAAMVFNDARLERPMLI
jgi:hypothetical protein